MQERRFTAKIVKDERDRGGAAEREDAELETGGPEGGDTGMSVSALNETGEEEEEEEEDFDEELVMDLNPALPDQPTPDEDLPDAADDVEPAPVSPVGSHTARAHGSGRSRARAGISRARSSACLAAAAMCAGGRGGARWFSGAAGCRGCGAAVRDCGREAATYGAGCD